MQAVLWCTESFSVKSTLEEHSQWITDVRFSPSMSRLATSSADKTVRVWDIDNVSHYVLLFSWSMQVFFFFFSLVAILDFSSAYLHQPFVIAIIMLVYIYTFEIVYREQVFLNLWPIHCFNSNKRDGHC